ncbi:MAG: hypothetical protein LBJ67_15070 [Planctomycetaceae bacterium]|jgi:hypothetical protein|nr:hypothetical protein [Planctomycetaceae bacterium]
MSCPLCPESIFAEPLDSGRLIFRELTPLWRQLFLQQLQEQIIVASKKHKIHEKSPLATLVEESLIVGSTAEMQEASRRRPASFVFVEFMPQHYRELVASIPRLRQIFPSWRIAVICFELPLMPIEEFEMFHAVFGEAGATAVISARTELLAMIPAVLSHFSNIPQKQTEWHKNIVERFPFKLY